MVEKTNSNSTPMPQSSDKKLDNGNQGKHGTRREMTIRKHQVNPRSMVDQRKQRLIHSHMEQPWEMTA